MALAGRATTTLELGTAVLQTYTSHPALMANRVLAVVDAMGRNGFTLGIGPSHEPVIEGSFGISYANPGRHTEEYVTILTKLLHGEAVEFHGDDFDVRLGAPATAEGVTVPVLVAALGRRLLRVAGAVADGTILWMANAHAVATHVAPLIRAAADAAGRDAPRIVAGLPVAVHDDVDEAREAAAKQFAMYGDAAQLPAHPRPRRRRGPGRCRDRRRRGRGHRADRGDVHRRRDRHVGGDLPRRRRPRGLTPPHPCVAARARSFVSAM